MKKQITIMTILFIAILLLIPCVSKATVSYTDTKINDLYYKIIDSENKKVEVTGIDDTNLKNVEVPSNVKIEGQTYTVTSIGYGAFDSCSLIDITLPNSIISIGEYAFSYCENLTTIIIPNSVTSIGKKAFSSCQQLKSIIIPNGVTSIEDNTFEICHALTDITLPNSIISIGNSAFMDCYNLKSITIPNSVASIGKEAFYNCESLTNLTIPNGITQIKEKTFNFCIGLQDIVIPKSVQSIDLTAFTFNQYGAGKEILMENIIINTYSGAYAETFAKENNIKYKILDEEKPNTKYGIVTLGGNGLELIGSDIEVSSDIYKEMRAELNKKGYNQIVCAYELEVNPKITSSVELTFDVGTINNGKQVMILHKLRNGTFEEFPKTVVNGKVVITVTEFSPFMLAMKTTTSTGGSSSSGSSSNTGTSNNGGNTNNSNNGNNDNSNNNKQDIKNDKDTSNSNKKNDNLDDTPKTGDRINTAFIVLAISSVCAIVSFIIIFKKRNAEA